MDKKTKILIVEDDEGTREMYVTVFKNSGFEVIEAEDGIAGLEKAAKDLPDIIFTGIIMPKMDGFSMMEALKKNVMTTNIPVIISSHMGREEDRQKANVLGAKYFFVRGYSSPKEIVDKVNQLFQQRKEYQLEINRTALDAPLLAKNLGLDEEFRCPEPDCDGRLVIKLVLNSGSVEAMLVCPSCGWQAR
jgi:two-component system, chemotaxis family, chemotaxis protein CheY